MNASTLRTQPASLSILHTIVPLALLLLCPLFAIVIWYTHVFLDGSLKFLIQLVLQNGILSTIFHIVRPVIFGSPTAWTMIGIFSVTQLLFMRMLPGKRFEGPPTPKGNVPVYTANGVPAFFLTLGLYLCCSVLFGWFSPAIVYDNFGPLLGALNLLSLKFCLVLYLKGRFRPSSSDCSTTGNVIFDYYWGTELYPRIFGFDVKMFTNCRFGMMSWSIIILSFAAKQNELYGLSNGMFIAVVLQLLYIGKFFWWETGYLSSLDIMHDRAGFYICWGCMVWVPSVYTAATLFLVNHPMDLAPLLGLSLFLVGTGFVLMNYFADRQRQLVRQTEGNCKIWGKTPELIVAHYTTAEGKKKQSLLLSSGYWGLSRHFHYIPELFAAFCWAMPAGFGYALPYFYVFFLSILLTHRSIRDDARCANKYGDAWKVYCQRVPHKIIPGVY